MEETSQEKEKAAETKNKAQNEQGNSTDQPTEAPPLSLSDLSKRMHCPINYKVTLPFLYDNDGKPKQPPEESLSHIPWRLRIEKGSQVAPSQRKAASTTGDPSDDEAPTNKDNLTFSSWTYLELRRQQNIAWASDRLKEGNELLFINPTRAETKFLEGLDLVPDHVDLLTAYAKLLLKHNNDLAAAETKLQRALEIDPNHALAKKTHLELVRIREGRIKMQRQQQQQLFQQDAPIQGDLMTNRKVQVAKKGNNIYSDVLMERALMGNDDDDDDKEVDSNNDSSSSRSRRRRKSKRDRKRKKKKKKHKRKRRRRYYSSESEDEDNSRSSRSGSSVEGDRDGQRENAETDKNGTEDNDPEKEREDSDSRDDRRHRKDRKRRRRHRKRRRRRYYSSEDDNSSPGSQLPTNGEGDDENGDIRTSTGNVDENDKVGSGQEKTEKEERSDGSKEDGSKDEGSHQRDSKRRRYRDDRKHRSRKKGRRHDTS